MIRRILRPARRVPLLFVLPVAAAFLFDILYHLYQYNVPRPDHDLDPPFFTSCQEPDVHAERENAVLVMLARNSERQQAKITIANIDRAFNQWFNYPIVFLNDEEWDWRFVNELNETARGLASFEVIPQDQWTFPKWIDEDAAKESIKEQGEAHIPHGDQEGYHHMCRFYSGKFYELEALKKYKWYWRLEPDVDFTCAITYDPFVQMAKHDKRYGYTIALWEVGKTCPSLFRDTADFKEFNRHDTTNLWKAMISPSWMPFPFRRFMSWFSHRDRYGDEWSLCHYWSNFEIADMDFFRSRAYQDYFEYLDKKGGFYFERWGDAAVHSLAVAMLLKPSEIHHFEDFGYRHDHLWRCPSNAPGGQLPDSKLLGYDDSYAPEVEGGIGCRCQCDGTKTLNHPRYCLNKLKQPNWRERSWFTLPERLP